VRRPGRRARAGAAGLIAVAALSGTAAGCSGPAAPGRGSVGSCAQFAIGAIRQHVTVTARPPACQGLTRLQVNLAVTGALHAVAAGLRGKARQRARMLSASRYVERLVTTVPARPGPPPAVPARPGPPPAVPAAHQASRPVLGLAAVCSWLITVGLGLSVLARWIGLARRRARAGQPWRMPARNAAHLGLAVTGLLIWVAYLATGVTGVAWAGCALLLPTAGLGMTLVFLTPSPARRPPVLVLGAHIAFATATILFAFLAAVGG
jgi:hypothetical protein